MQTSQLSTKVTRPNRFKVTYSTDLSLNLVESKSQDFKENRGNEETLKTGYESYMKDQKKRVDGYRESKDKYYNMAKVSVIDLKPAELRKLSSPESQDLFRFFFELLWGLAPSQFEYSKFKSIALDKDAEDFQSRLAIFDLNRFAQNPALEE